MNSPARPGSYSSRLPRGAALAQGLIAAPVPPVGADGHELALLTALALGGSGGLLEGTLPPTGPSRAAARVVGTAHAAALVIDIRAPADLLSPAMTEVRALIARLAQSGLSTADIARAVGLAAQRDSEARAEPRRRLIQRWSGRSSAVREAPVPPALSAFLAATLREEGLVVVEARPE
jgi:hypothetical protein